MIIVTGASGQLGQLIVQSLARTMPPADIIASMRDPAKGASIADLGVEIRQGDFNDAESLARSFRGASQVLIVSSNARATGGDPIAQHRTALSAAIDAGAKRVVYTSQMSSSPTSAFPPARDHATTEAMLAASGVAWTALRNGFYADSGLRFMGDAIRTAQIDAPLDGKTAWTAHVDLADAAAAILASEGAFDGPTPPLTGNQALDLGDLAQVAAVLTGKPAQRNVLDDAAFNRSLGDRGLPSGAISTMLGYYIAARNGEFAAVDPTLERLIGRQPQSMRQIIADRLLPNAR